MSQTSAALRFMAVEHDSLSGDAQQLLHAAADEIERLARIETRLREEHANGHLLMGEFCPICQASKP